MEVCRIARSHGSELAFQGVCLIQVAGSPDDEVAPGRWHEISVYRQSDDAWVVSIRYFTRCADEREYTEAEVIDDASEIESMLLCCEPLQHIDRRTLGQLSNTERRHLCDRIWANYLDLVNRVLDAVAPYLAPPASEVKTLIPPEEHDAPDFVRGIFRKLFSLVGGESR